MTPYEVVARVVDPELRVVTIEELGILRSVEPDGDRAVVTITPTYSGCPAMDVIQRDVAAALRQAGWAEVEVVTRLRPPWTTDWISESGREKLAAAGIAPPGPARVVPLGLPDAPAPAARVPEPPAPAVPAPEPPACPRCGDRGTDEISRFGSTPCKSLWRCPTCAEPFEHVKAF